MQREIYSWPGGGAAPKIFPNPFNDTFTLRVGGDFTDYPLRMRIRDARGREVYTGTLQHADQRIHAGALPSGIYFLELESGKTSVLYRPKLIRN